MKSTLGRRVAQTAVFLERYGLSLAFFCMAGVRLHHLIVLDPAERAAIAAAPLVEVLRQVIWVQLYLYAGLMLLLGRRVTVPPQKLTDLLLPLGTTFFNLAYSAEPWFPDAFKSNSLAPSASHFGTAYFSNEVVARVFPGGDCDRGRPAPGGCFW